MQCFNHLKHFCGCPNENRFDDGLPIGSLLVSCLLGKNIKTRLGERNKSLPVQCGPAYLARA